MITGLSLTCWSVSINEGEARVKSNLPLNVSMGWPLYMDPSSLLVQRTHVACHSAVEKVVPKSCAPNWCKSFIDDYQVVTEVCWSVSINEGEAGVKSNLPLNVSMGWPLYIDPSSLLVQRTHVACHSALKKVAPKSPPKTVVILS